MTAGFRDATRWSPVLVLGLGSLFVGSSLVRGAELRELLQSHGLLALEPPRPATDFALPRFDGGEHSLSEFSGSWVVLTFWASWCGPCRAEMPSLEALHRSRVDRGVVVLGVSVDRDAAAARGFIDQYRLSFPQVWDRQSRVGATYEATAIPVSYLVDPEGRLVAVSRGARDWTQLTGLMDSLIERVPPAAGAQAVYAAATEPPAVADPPSAELVLSDTSPRPGQEFVLEVHLHWAGDMAEYLPQPPRLHLPEGMTQKAVTASTSSRDGAQVVVYRITLEAAKAGSYALDPVELRYRLRTASELQTTRLAGPTVSVEPRTLLGLRPGAFLAVSGGVAATALAGLVAGWRWKTSRSRRPVEGDPRFDDQQSRLQQARALRLQGDASGAGLVLVELLEELRDEPSEKTAIEMASLAENLRFGGYVPSAGELDRMQREVGRRLEASRPDPRTAARGALRLQDDEERS